MKDWATCEHEWRVVVDSQFHSQRELDVKCHKCGCPGAKNNTTGHVFWPAT